MSRNRIQSNMLFSPKSRSEGKTSWPRRRATKTAATVNGEYDPDLALAIQESLKQAELDAQRDTQKQDNKVFEMKSESSKENRATHQRNKTTMIEISNETNQLKDLVNVHMDLIQQQQDVINQKDKAIKGLKAENNALQCRLQRMERRMALLKQKEDMAQSGTGHITHSPPPKPGTMSYTEPMFTPPPDRHTNKSRKSDVTNLSSKKPPELVKSSPMKTVNTPTSNQIRKGKRESHRKRKHATTSDNCDSDSSVLQTNNPYFVSYYEPDSEEIEVETRPDIVKSAQSQLEVECPTYRLKTYSNLYVIEGTEDHEDETFIRRHQKPEIEEKRRKRWDNQRMREETLHEKQKEREYTSRRFKKPEDPVETFYPQLEDIRDIEIMDKIPVSAFGHPIPSIKQESFVLPWNPKPLTSHRLRHK